MKTMKLFAGLSILLGLAACTKNESTNNTAVSTDSAVSTAVNTAGDTGVRGATGNTATATSTMVPGAADNSGGKASSESAHPTGANH